MKCKCGCGQELSIKASKEAQQPSRQKRNMGYIRGHRHKGHLHPNWNGGRFISTQGYVLIYKPEHPFCNGRGYIAENRLVMENHINRYLYPHERVHHINGNKQDNKLENLLIVNMSEHMSFHIKNNPSMLSHLKNNTFAAKFTYDEIKAIKLLAMSKIMKQKDIAKLFNTNPRTIRTIKANKRLYHQKVII